MAGPGRNADALWRLRSALAVLSVVVFGILFGFVILPVVEGGAVGLGPWAAFCRAVGLRPDASAPQPSAGATSAVAVSQVAWTPQVLTALSHADRKKGETLASGMCFSCHGQNGVSAIPQYPILAGQSAVVIYKQLHDYASGARSNPIMTPMIQSQKLDDGQMADISAYFGDEAASGSLGQRAPLDDEPTDRLVERGDPARGIPACNDCHATGVGGPLETPTLGGQHHEYLAAQLRLYASAQRHNDVYQRMRAIAAKLSEPEIDAVARYYEGAPR